MVELWVGFFTSISIFLIFLFVYISIDTKKKHQVKRIIGDEGIENDKKKIDKFFLNVMAPAEFELKEIDMHLNALGLEQSSEKIVIQGGYYAVIFSLSYFLIGVSFSSLPMAFVLAILGLSLGYMFPRFLLKQRFNIKKKELDKGLLSFIDMLQIVIESGSTLNLAIDKVYEYHPAEISKAFKMANNKYLAGIARRKQAFEEILMRTNEGYFKILIDIILQGFETGAPISKELSILSRQIRRERRKGLKDAARESKWKSFVISVLFQLPPFIVIIMGPSFHQLTQIM